MLCSREGRAATSERTAADGAVRESSRGVGMILTAPISDLSRLVHKRRVRLDPLFRGELVRLFDNPRARIAYFSKRGLSVDDLGEAIWEAKLCTERPSPREVFDILENLFTPG